MRFAGQFADNLRVERSRRKTVTFDPKDPAWRGKLWVRLNTSDGIKVFILWSRVWKVAVVLAIVGWLGLAGAAWAFVKYKRGIKAASYLDIAFYPLRHRHYRETLSDHAYANAKKHLEAGAWPKAISSLRTAVANNPDNLAARRDLAAFYHQIGRPDTAINLLEEGLSHGKTDPEYLRTLLKLLEFERRHERIRELCESLLPADPDGSASSHEIVRAQIKAATRLGRYDEARTLLTKWNLAQTPTGQIMLAEVDLASGHRSTGIQRLEHLLAMQPSNELAGIMLVRLYREDGRIDEARRIAVSRVLLRPDSPGARVDLIALLHQAGDQAAFQRERDDFLAQFSADERALLLLAATAGQINEPELTQLILEHSPVDTDGRKSPRLMLAHLQNQCRSGDYEQALQTAAFLGDYPALGDSIQVALSAARAWASFGLNKPTEGQTWLNQFFTQQSSAFTPNAVLLATQLESMGLQAETRRLRQALVERNPGEVTFLATLVSDDLEQQSWDAVRTNLPTLLNLNPKPVELIARIWQAQDNLNLSPDLRRRLQIAAAQ